MRMIEITEDDKEDIVDHGRQALKHLKKMIECFMEREVMTDDEDDESDDDYCLRHNRRKSNRHNGGRYY